METMETGDKNCHDFYCTQMSLVIDAVYFWTTLLSEVKRQGLGKLSESSSI